MIKAILVDDEPLVLQLLERILKGRNDVQVIASYSDPELALVEIPQLQPDIVFLDVDMPELNGIELGTRLLATEESKEMAIVFVTAYEQYAIHAFKLNAIHYILKPVDPQSVHEAVSRIEHKRTVVQSKPSDGGEINLFGHMHLRVNGAKVDFLTAKIEELLALLVMNRDKGISKWRIIDLLWEDSSMEKSQQNLYTMIFRLKKKLRNIGIMAEIHCKNSIYTMNLKDVSCDLMEFDRLVAQNLDVKAQNIAEFEKAISIYKGELLEEKDYLWCVHDRHKYYQQFIDLVMEVATYYVRNKQPGNWKKLYYSVENRLIEEDIQLLKDCHPN